MSNKGIVFRANAQRRLKQIRQKKGARGALAVWLRLLSSLRKAAWSRRRFCSGVVLALCCLGAATPMVCEGSLEIAVLLLCPERCLVEPQVSEARYIRDFHICVALVSPTPVRARRPYRRGSLASFTGTPPEGDAHTVMPFGMSLAAALSPSLFPPPRGNVWDGGLRETCRQRLGSPAGVSVAARGAITRFGRTRSNPDDVAVSATARSLCVPGTPHRM